MNDPIKEYWVTIFTNAGSKFVISVSDYELSPFETLTRTLRFPKDGETHVIPVASINYITIKERKP